jgi:hypothetical protein
MAAALITPLSLGQSAITTSYTTLYTVPTGLKTFVKDIDIVNTTGSAIGIYVSLVPSGGTASSSNAIFYNNALPAYTTVQWCGSQVLTEGATIQVKASAVGCTVTATGGEVAV